MITRLSSPRLSVHQGKVSAGQIVENEFFICFSCCSRCLDAQVERNLQDAMGVARNVCFDPRLVPGGGAVEMAVSHSLSERADNIQVASSIFVHQV